MTQVANRSTAGSAVAALQSLKQGLQNVSAAMPARNTDPFLRMQTDGVWVYGAENVEVQDGSLWAINPFSIRHGYSCWTSYSKEELRTKKSNEKLGEVMVPAGTAKPSKTELTDHGWEWKDQVSFTLICLNGDDTGVQVLYNTSSVGGLNAAGGVIAALMNQLDKDDVNFVPAVTLENDHYQHKTWGKTYTPVIDVKKWLPMTDAMPDIHAEEEAAAQADAPAETTKAAEPARGRGRVAAAEGVAEKQPEPAAAAATAANDEPRRRRRPAA